MGSDDSSGEDTDEERRLEKQNYVLDVAYLGGSGSFLPISLLIANDKLDPRTFILD
jgi:hypothetical protein